MGIAREAVHFAGDVPMLEAVRDRVAARTGQAIDLTRTNEDRGTLAFACLPELAVWVRRHGRTQPFGKTEACLPSPDTVEVEIGLLADPTLFFQTCQALLDLGGTVEQEPLPANDPFLQPVDEAELHRRARKARRDGRIGCALAVVLHTLLLPVYLLAVGTVVITILPLVFLVGLWREAFGDPRPTFRR